MTHNFFRTSAMFACIAGGAVLLSGCGRGTNDAATPGSSSSSAATSGPSSGPSSGGSSGSVAALESALEVGTVDPCTLLTQAEVDSSVGQPLQAGSRVLPQDCQWSTTDFTADVDLTIGQWDQTKAAATAASRPPTAVAGVGDEALNLNGSNGSYLYVRKGDTGFIVEVNGPHIDGLPDHGLAQEVELAKAVVGRL
jgi:Protein of unknown function (DUF3558)